MEKESMTSEFIDFVKTDEQSVLLNKELCRISCTYEQTILYNH